MNFLVDPSDVIKYDRTVPELELWWLFSCVVAGKTAKTQARLLNNFLNSLDAPSHHPESPFRRIQKAVREGKLLDKLKESRLGQFTRLNRQFTESLMLDLRTCQIDDLEAIHGCGPKTARMFLMMSRPKQRVAALDTHVLKHLRENGVAAPLATPSAGPTYRRLEEEFLKLADAAEMEVSDYDLMVWKRFSGNETEHKEAA